MNKQPFYHRMEIRFLGMPDAVWAAASGPDLGRKLVRLLQRHLGPIVGTVDTTVREEPEPHGPKRKENSLTQMLMTLPAFQEAMALRKFDVEILFTGTSDYSIDANGPEFLKALGRFVGRALGSGAFGDSVELVSPVDAEPGDPADLM